MNTCYFLKRNNATKTIMMPRLINTLHDSKKPIEVDFAI